MERFGVRVIDCGEITKKLNIRYEVKDDQKDNECNVLHKTKYIEQNINKIKDLTEKRI